MRGDCVPVPWLCRRIRHGSVSSSIPMNRRNGERDTLAAYASFGQQQSLVETAKKKRRCSKAYTPEQKIAYVEHFRHQQLKPGCLLSQRRYSQMNQLSHARFSAWCKDYDRLKALDPSRMRTTRLRKCAARFPALESKVYAWLDAARRQGCEPNTKFIQSVARTFAEELGIADFVASTTWVGRFKKRTGARMPLMKPCWPDTAAAATTTVPARQFSVIRSTSTESTSSSTSEYKSMDLQEQLVGEILQVGEVLQNFLRRNDDVGGGVEMAGMEASIISSSLRRKKRWLSNHYQPVREEEPEELPLRISEEENDEDEGPYFPLPFPKRTHKITEYFDELPAMGTFVPIE